MLESLTVENFTVFEQAEFKFGKNINVFIGENGTGKTHVLKLLYAFTKSHEETLKRKDRAQLPGDVYPYNQLMILINSIESVFSLTHKISVVRSSNSNKNQYKIVLNLKDEDEHAYIDISGNTGIFSSSNDCKWKSVNSQKSIFIPAKEIASLVVEIKALSKDHRLVLDATYTDLAESIQNGRITNDEDRKTFEGLITDIADAVQGKIEQDPSGKLTYNQNGLGTIELFAVAEGWRKLATLGWLIYNGSITKNSVLFWDEPESNLNPKLIRQLARILVELSKQEIQIFLATHNLVLLKELDLILEQENLGEGASAFFALSRDDASQPVQVSQGPTLSDVDPIVALDEELEQASLHLKRARQRAL